MGCERERMGGEVEEREDWKHYSYHPLHVLVEQIASFPGPVRGY